MTSYQNLDVNVSLEKPRLFYSPGSTIKGTVELTSESDLPLGRVEVALSGRSLSRIEKPNGQSKSTFVGSAELFSEASVLYEGHYTHKAGLFSWPFEFQIPKFVSIETVNAGRWKKSSPFISNEVSIEQSQQVLPPSFKFVERKTSSRWQANVEYAIEVKISRPQNGRLFSSSDTRAVQIPISLFPPTPGGQTDLHDPRRRHGSATDVSISSLKLLPGHANSSPSLINRAKTLFSSSSIPRFTFETDVSYPTRIDNYHTRPLPFVVAISPNTDPSLTTIQPVLETFYRYPSVRIKSFILNLDVSTLCRCTSTLSEDPSEESKYSILLIKRHFGEEDNRVKIAPRSMAWDQKTRREEDVPASIDLGNLCDIRLSRTIVRPSNDKKGKRPEKQGGAEIFFTPSFATFNVAREYHFSWKIEVSCAGEVKVLNGKSEQAIQIVGRPSMYAASVSFQNDPSLYEDESWIRPPSSEGENGWNIGSIEHGSLEVDVPPRYQAPTGAVHKPLSKG